MKCKEGREGKFEHKTDFKTLKKFFCQRLKIPLKTIGMNRTPLSNQGLSLLHSILHWNAPTFFDLSVARGLIDSPTSFADMSAENSGIDFIANMSLNTF